MKKLISITAVFLMIFAGCSKDVNLNSPIEKQTTEEYLTHEAPEGLSINGSFSVTKEIDGAQVDSYPMVILAKLKVVIAGKFMQHVFSQKVRSAVKRQLP